MIEKTIPICYPAGGYGTYLEWVLTTMSTTGLIQHPFNKNGNSHKFFGNQFMNIQKWHKYVKQDQPVQWGRLHPKTEQSQSIANNLNAILSTVKKIIHIYPDQNSVLLLINNYFTKLTVEGIWEDWWNWQFSNLISPDKIYNNWPVNRDVDINKIPVWVQREFLSYYLMPAWHDQVEWFFPDTWQNDQCCTVMINDLLYNFEETVSNLKNFCDVNWVRPVEDMLSSHSIMMSLQKNLNQDMLCNQIVDSVINKIHFDWSTYPLPLASQCWIQWQLRNFGYEIQCHGLDRFPTDSNQFKKLLYIK